MLFVSLASIADWVCAQLDQAVVQLAMRPVELWVRGVTEAKRGKLHLLKTSWAQSSAAQGLPERLAVGWQLALAGG